MHGWRGKWINEGTDDYLFFLFILHHAYSIHIVALMLVLLLTAELQREDHNGGLAQEDRHLLEERH